MYEGTLKNLNRVPEKNYLAFLNMLGTKILPSSLPGFLSLFKLGKVQRVRLCKEGNQVSANPQDGGSPVVFETENSILAYRQNCKVHTMFQRKRILYRKYRRKLLSEIQPVQIR
jgi:hypothetical protein